MKIAVIGCGAMGSYFASHLSTAHEVVCIDTYKKKVEAINQNGILIEENDERKNYFVKAYLNGEYDGEVDIVVLFVKSTQIVSALEQNKNLFHENTVVLSLQNGLGNERDIQKFVKPENIIMGNTLINCVSKDITYVKKSGNGMTYVGSLVGNKKMAIACKICLQQAGFSTEQSDDVHKMIWWKLLVNCTLNPLCAMFRCKIKNCYENKYIWGILDRILKEAVDVARLDGVDFDYEKAEEHVKEAVYNVGKGYPSMYQDVEAKRMTEIEKINGAIVNLAYKYGYSAPYNEFVLNSIKAIEKLY
jgi:2-dehydropantoate 2-reductase